jgi:fatty acid desaturase
MSEEFFQVTGAKKGTLFWAHDWRDGALVFLSALEVAACLAPALLGWVPHPDAGWIALGAFLIWLNCTNYQCVAHNLIHTPFFRSAHLNRAFSIFNSLALGVPQTLYRVHHLNHHRYNNWTGDRSSIYRFSRNAESAESILAYSFLGPIRTEFGFLFEGARQFGASLWYLGQVAAFAENYLEHYGADPRRFEANSVSSYGRFYNWIWFNNGYHQEHHYRPQLHWTKLPALRAAILPESERRTVPWDHAFGIFKSPNRLNTPESYGVLALHDSFEGVGEGARSIVPDVAQPPVRGGERGRGEDRGLSGRSPGTVPSRQADPVDLL